MNIPAARRALGFIIAPFGVALMVGGACEVLVGVAPSLLPDGGATIDILHENVVVHAWVVLQGLISIPLGLSFMRAGVGLMARSPQAAARARRAAAALLGLILTAQALLAIFLYPSLVQLPQGAIEPSAEFWIACLVGAALGPCVLSLISLWLLRKTPDEAGAPSQRPS